LRPPACRNFRSAQAQRIARNRDFILFALDGFRPHELTRILISANQNNMRAQQMDQPPRSHSRTKRPSGLTDLSEEATRDIGAALVLLLADVFALYIKTKNFHWHMSGVHFRDHHLLLDEQGEQLFAMTDPIAERARKIGSSSLRSVGAIARAQRISDNDADYVEPQDMLAELREDNRHLVSAMRQVHNTCSEHGDVGTTSLLEMWIDEAERRCWFLYETSHRAPGSNA
jgi:starvation-inducible DNA-binding protein